MHQFKEFIYQSGVKNADGKAYESYSVSNTFGFVNQAEQFKNGGMVLQADKSKSIIVEPKSFAYNPARLDVGSIGYQNLNKSVLISPMYVVFKANNKIVLDEFLWHYFKSRRFNKIVLSTQEGGVRTCFNFDKLENTKIYLPNSLVEQSLIIEFLNKIDELSDNLQSMLRALKKYKKGLINALYQSCSTSESHPLSYFLNEYSERNQNNYKAVAVGKNGIRSREEIFSKEIAKDISNNKVISKNTLVIGMGTKEIDIGILIDDIKLSVSPAYRTFNIANINPIYLEQILSSENKLLSTKFMIQSARQGKTINVQGFLNYKIRIHDQNKQEIVSRLIESLNNFLNVLERKMDHCKKIKEYFLKTMFI